MKITDGNAYKFIYWSDICQNLVKHSEKTTWTPCFDFCEEVLGWMNWILLMQDALNEMKDRVKHMMREYHNNGKWNAGISNGHFFFKRNIFLPHFS